MRRAFVLTWMIWMIAFPARAVELIIIPPADEVEVEQFPTEPLLLDQTEVLEGEDLPSKKELVESMAKVDLTIIGPDAPSATKEAILEERPPEPEEVEVPEAMPAEEEALLLVEEFDLTTGEEIYEEFETYEEEAVEESGEEVFEDELVEEPAPPELPPAEMASATSPEMDSSWFAVAADRSDPSTSSRAVHALLKSDVYGARNDNPARTLRDQQNGEFVDAFPSLGYERTDGDGVTYRGSLGARFTDNPSIQLNELGGKHGRIEGSPLFEAQRGGDFLARLGEFTPAFSAYTASQSTLGTHLVKQYPRKGGITELQFFGGRMDREDAPTRFRRVGGGARIAQSWMMRERGELRIAGQVTAFRDQEQTITEMPAAVAIPQNDVASASAMYTHPKGFAAGMESAHSDSEIQDFAAAVRTFDKGHARREWVSYTHPASGRGIQLQHERVEPTFLASEATAGDDLDHQSVLVTFPIVAQKVTLTTSFNRVYNDLLRLRAGRGENRTFQTDLMATPFAAQQSRWLSGLSFGAGHQSSENDATDRSFDTFNEQYTVTVGQTVGRLTGSYQWTPRRELDELQTANSWHRNQHTYAMGYTIDGGRDGGWHVKPALNHVRSLDRNDSTATVDRKGTLTVGFEGACGRTQFGYTLTDGDETIRTSNSWTDRRSHQARIERALADDGDGARLAVAYTDNENLSTGQASQRDRMLRGSLTYRW